MSYTLTQERKTTQKAQPIFRGWLTQLLHEAFYMEENPELEVTSDPTPDEKVFEEEEEVEQFEFLKQFLGGRNFNPN